MRTITFILSLLISFIMAFSQTKITLSAHGQTMNATLVDNPATRKLLKMLPVNVELSPYGGFELVGPLHEPLPATDSHITAAPGDIMLYQGKYIVVFYGRNSWSYTPIGKIDGVSEESLKKFLGNGNIRITLSNDEEPAKREMK